MQEYNIKELLKKDKARIRWVNYGVANTFPYNFKDKEYKIIELNKALIDYPELFTPILMHELRHSKKLFSKDDVINDFSYANLRSLPNFRILLFMLSHPNALTQLLPAYYSNKNGLVFDINLSLIYAISLIVGLIIKLKVL
jgi:hypothetical protein